MERLMQRVGLAQKAIGKLLELSCKAVFLQAWLERMAENMYFSE